MRDEEFKRYTNAIAGAFLMWAVAAILAFAGWVTHIVVCIKAATWGLLIAGAIMFPIGIIHGWGVWLGIW